MRVRLLTLVVGKDAAPTRPRPNPASVRFFRFALFFSLGILFFAWLFFFFFFFFWTMWNLTVSLAICGVPHYPRIDPVIISGVVSKKTGNFLLIRGTKFPKGMHSVVSGFMNPGETIEEAVRREVKEETGVTGSLFCRFFFFFFFFFFLFGSHRLEFFCSWKSALCSFATLAFCGRDHDWMHRCLWRWWYCGRRQGNRVRELPFSKTKKKKKNEIVANFFSRSAIWCSHDEVKSALETGISVQGGFWTATEFRLPPPFAIAHHISKAWLAEPKKYLWQASL